MTNTEQVRASRISTTHGVQSRLASVLDRLRTRRDERAAYKLAERELATYTTEADRQELDAMLERSDGDGDVYTQIIESKRLYAA